MSTLANDTAEDHGEVILDEEIFETICSQHSTQSSAIESSLNASLTKLSASRSATRSKPHQNPVLRFNPKIREMHLHLQLQFLKSPTFAKYCTVIRNFPHHFSHGQRMSLLVIQLLILAKAQ